MKRNDMKNNIKKVLFIFLFCTSFLMINQAVNAAAVDKTIETKTYAYVETGRAEVQIYVNTDFYIK